MCGDPHIDVPLHHYSGCKDMSPFTVSVLCGCATLASCAWVAPLHMPATITIPMVRSAASCPSRWIDIPIIVSMVLAGVFDPVDYLSGALGVGFFMALVMSLNSLFEVEDWCSSVWQQRIVAYFIAYPLSATGPAIIVAGLKALFQMMV